VTVASDPLDRAALVAAARDSIAKGSRSFGLASRIFDKPTRERAWLLYAWCRACDDIADGQDHGGVMRMAEGEAKARVADIRRLTDFAMAGQATDNPAFDALGLLNREVPLPRRFIDALLEGFDRDAADWHPRSEADLFSYCYNVAGSVGCLMAIIMGVDPADEDTLDRACDLGIAFQLANIARDIAEDNAADRCYLPEEWLVEMDMPPGQHMHPAFRKRLAVIAKWLAEFVEMYEASAQIGAARLPFRARWAVLAAAGIYGDIAFKVRERGEHAWDHRVSTSGREKAAHVATALKEALRPSATTRDARRRLELWTRPR
jgi:15-cis-phytoene synthase